MTNELRTAIQEEFADVYTIPNFAKLYAEIRLECDKQLDFIVTQIKKEALNNAE